MLACDIIRILPRFFLAKYKAENLARVLNWLQVLRESSILRFNFAAAMRRIVLCTIEWLRDAARHYRSGQGGDKR